MDWVSLIYYNVLLLMGILLLAYGCGMLYAFSRKIAWAMFFLFGIFVAVAFLYVLLTYVDKPSQVEFNGNIIAGALVGGFFWRPVFGRGKRTLERIRREWG